MSLTWSKPEIDYNKINVKGLFSREKPSASVGTIMRVDEGEWLRGYAGNIGIAHPVTADLMAPFTTA